MGGSEYKACMRPQPSTASLCIQGGCVDSAEQQKHQELSVYSNLLSEVSSRFRGAVEVEEASAEGGIRLKIINEATMFKILVEGNGMLLSVTTKKRAFFFFVSRRFIGLKVAPTTDPYPGIVEICDYDILRILSQWDRLHSVKFEG